MASIKAIDAESPITEQAFGMFLKELGSYPGSCGYSSRFIDISYDTSSKYKDPTDASDIRKYPTPFLLLLVRQESKSNSSV
jgi:hypothetical protein